MEPLKDGAFLRRCQEWHDRHLHLYFTQRDLEGVLETYHENAVGVGTGRSEYGSTPDALREVVRRDLGGFPDRIDHAIKQRDFYLITDGVVLCQADLDLALDVNAHRMNLRDLRHTVIARISESGEPHICHIHVSFPTTVHGDEEPYPLKEIEEISAVVDELIANKTENIMSAYRKLEHMAIRDRLTGLYNRIRLDEKLKHELTRANRYGSPFSIVLLDIDAFKTINDAHGHLAGDSVLVRLGELLRKIVRDTDLAGRWGGEEFMLVLPETGARQALVMSERIRTVFADQRFEVADQVDIGLTLSAGITSFTSGDDFESLFQRADQALYQAKRTGKNRCLIEPAPDGCV
jgi:diguanylate cyclase (GGDEF)-like protein